jgi:glycosyltransferase involved in cell wall biosynthesis
MSSPGNVRPPEKGVRNSRISLVTPSYNQGTFVERTVRSVVLQDYPDLEYFFMDGGSSDHTLTLVEPYRRWISHFSSGPDGGQAAALADAFRRSTGDIMGYLNSDDLLAPGTLSFVDAYFKRHPRVDAIYSHRVVIDPNDIVTRFWFMPPHSNFLLTRWPMIPQETCFWRRRLFQEMGNVDPSISFAMDYELFVRYMQRGKFVCVNRFLGAFRVHPGSKTSSAFDTQGQADIREIWRRHGIRLRRGQSALGSLFHTSIHLLGKLYAVAPFALPGTVHGLLGKDYDMLVWNGALKREAVECPA